MRSIRLSLLVYFLGLLIVALGVASLLIYDSAQRTLELKEKAATKLIELKYVENCQKERARQDEELLGQAQALARRVRPEMKGIFVHEKAVRPYLLTTNLALPMSHFVVALTLARDARVDIRPGRFDARRPQQPMAYVGSAFVNVKLAETEVVLPDVRKRIEHYRIDTNYPGDPLLPTAASPGERTLPHSPDFAPNDVVAWAFDDQALGEEPVRRVRLKTAMIRPTFPPGVRPEPRPNGGGGGRGGPGGGGRGRPEVPPPPRRDPFVPRVNVAQVSLVIQCAADLDGLTRQFEAFREARDSELAHLREETTRALSTQRNRLLTISSVTFVATVLGCFALVWVGLLPLRRMSEAVSRVSPRDFRLAGVEPAKLPAELRPIAERLVETLELLKRAFSREKQATADISHELRTPLTALLTTIELALRKQRPAEAYREFLHDCRTSALQMNQIVERLLTLARLDAGVDRLRTQPVDVDELAEQCATVVRPLAEAKGLRLSVSHPDRAQGAAEQSEAALPQLQTDPDKLREVVNNLLHNAIQYNRPDGSIDLRVARANGRVALEVSDTGIGIPPEAREMIFERFYRADPSRTGDGLNAGLGLAIVKEYVELMGGSITVRSEEGRGSTFRIELPASPPLGVSA